MRSTGLLLFCIVGLGTVEACTSSASDPTEGIVDAGLAAPGDDSGTSFDASNFPADSGPSTGETGVPDGGVLTADAGTPALGADALIVANLSTITQSAQIPLTASKVGPSIVNDFFIHTCPAKLASDSSPYGIIEIRNPTIYNVRLDLTVSSSAAQVQLAVYTNVPDASNPSKWAFCQGLYSTGCSGKLACLIDSNNNGVLINSNHSIFAVVQGPSAFSGTATLNATTVGFF